MFNIYYTIRMATLKIYLITYVYIYDNYISMDVKKKQNKAIGSSSLTYIIIATTKVTMSFDCTKYLSLYL